MDFSLLQMKMEGLSPPWHSLCFPTAVQTPCLLVLDKVFQHLMPDNCASPLPYRHSVILATDDSKSTETGRLIPNK